MTSQRNKIILVAAAILGGLIVWWLLASRARQIKLSTLPEITPNNSQFSTETDAIIDPPEAFPTTDEQEMQQELEQRLATDPWSKLLPTFQEHFIIYYNEKKSVDIVLKSKNKEEFDQYQQEAIKWLAEQQAPINQLKMNVTYQGQPAN